MSSPPRKNWLEWVVFGIGLVLLLATTGYLAVQTIRPATQPPTISVTFGTAERSASGYTVAIEVRNTGAEPAAGVRVEAALAGGAGETADERAEIHFDYLPGYARRSARLEFTRDPRQGTLTVRSLSFAVP
jgi:uncharacterized protein (TIGR02588 family)